MSRPPDQTRDAIDFDMHNFDVAKKRAVRNDKRTKQRHDEVVGLLDRLIDIYPLTRRKRS